MFSNVYKGRKVLITGHTGFKGSWLALWLMKLGAEVVGVSKDVPTTPALFDVLSLDTQLRHIKADVRDLGSMQEILDDVAPDFVFHLAAQAIVSTSYRNPVETMTTNAIGTMNLLEVLRSFTKPCVTVFITSDKCYDNVEWLWGYREDDALGGKDIYSGSKGAAELIIKSYQHSFFENSHPVKLGIGRAGNVIGGGDWASDRIIADCMRAWDLGKSVEIRSPHATRPWQHVLEPLSGYLTLGRELFENSELHGEAFNFGPKSHKNQTVLALIEVIHTRFGACGGTGYRVIDSAPFREASLLKLNCDKALALLSWEANLEHDEMVHLVADWYQGFYKNDMDMQALTMSQIEFYEQVARQKSRVWAHA